MAENENASTANTSGSQKPQDKPVPTGNTGTRDANPPTGNRGTFDRDVIKK